MLWFGRRWELRRAASAVVGSTGRTVGRVMSRVISRCAPVSRLFSVRAARARRLFVAPSPVVEDAVLRRRRRRRSGTPLQNSEFSL
jgi:hypothetical protein